MHDRAPLIPARPDGWVTHELLEQKRRKEQVIARAVLEILEAEADIQLYNEILERRNYE